MTGDVLPKLWAIIDSRKKELPPNSYTTQLFTLGEVEILKKIGEEAVEVILAASAQGDDQVLYESADLLYHIMVMLAMRGLTWQQLEDELARRFQT